MGTQQQATPREARVIGIVAAAAGLYFILIGLAVLPVPGGRANLHGPLWIALLAGGMFFFAGVAVLLQAIGKANATGELPAGAPLWLRAAQYLLGVAMFAGFAIIGSWIALAGEAGQFSGGLPFLGALNISLARIAFGFGALICWAATIGYAVSGARKLFGRGSQQT
jgi:hypothetical protein